MKEANILPLVSSAMSCSAAMKKINMPSDFFVYFEFNVFWRTIDMDFDRGAPFWTVISILRFKPETSMIACGTSWKQH